MFITSKLYDENIFETLNQKYLKVNHEKFLIIAF